MAQSRIKLNNNFFKQNVVLENPNFPTKKRKEKKTSVRNPFSSWVFVFHQIGFYAYCERRIIRGGLRVRRRSRARGN